MDMTISEIQENFRSKADGDLLSLASTSSAMSPESRVVLLEELKRRHNTIKDDPTTIQLVHGWYTVFVHRGSISFPEQCPNCLRASADTGITFNSKTETRYRVLYVKQRSLTLRVPYCRECATRLTLRRTIAACTSGCIIIAWLVACWKFDLGQPAVVWGTMMLSVPVVLLSRQGAAVRLGDFGVDWLECRFRSAEYAEAFASANHVLQHNTDTIREEFEAAINSVQGRSSGVSVPPTRNADCVYMVRPKKD
jgi:hypothetical protein